MNSMDRGPHYLAEVVLRALSVTEEVSGQAFEDVPDQSLLNFFFGVLYQASFRRDQGQHTVCNVLWRDPASLLSLPLSRQGAQGWSYLSFAQPVPFNVNSLVYLSKAADRKASALAVHAAPKQKPVIHGLVNFGPETLMPASSVPSESSGQAGAFRAIIVGPAHIIVDVGLKHPVELRWNALNAHSHAVLQCGPVRERLSRCLGNLVSHLQAQLPSEIISYPFFEAKSIPLAGGSILINDYDWAETLERLWTDALAQVLLKIFEERQGGAVLITPTSENRLKSQQAVNYPQLRLLLEQRGVFWMTEHVLSAKALAERALTVKEIALDDQILHEPELTTGPRGSDEAIHQTIAFLASLARLDGILLFNPHLELTAFGGQAADGEFPETVYLAGDELATESGLSALPYQSFGTRNQALIRQCYQDQEALAFALTQDGDIRAMRWFQEKIVVWDRVNLRRGWDGSR